MKKVELLIAIAIFMLWLVWVCRPTTACSAGMCGNTCISSADCMADCVCMNDGGPGLGTCVSFN